MSDHWPTLVANSIYPALAVCLCQVDGEHLTLVDIQYSETCLRWSLCKTVTSLKQPANLAPNSTKALQPTSVEQLPLY